MSLNASILITPLIDIITGKIIEAGTSMVPTKLVARANELIAINTALTAINAGSTTGLPALQAAFNTQSLTPGEALALQSLFAALSKQISILTEVAGSTLIGQGATVIMDSILAAASSVAQAYVTKYSAAATTAGAK